MSTAPTTATIVFTDLVGSTALRVSLGEERADRLRELHDEILSACVADHNGRVVKGGGDGLLAVFESATDALSGSVAMQVAAAEYGQRADAIAPLSIRIGISTGDVSWDGGDCFGLPVVEAARLEAAAEGGQILCSELVRMLSRGRGGHEFESIGFLELKGLPEPVAASSVMWSHPEPTPALGLPRALASTKSTPLVGRTGELAALRTLLSDPAQLRSAWLVGEPGIGKSRVATELARLAFDEGHVVLFGRCDEDLSVPYQPFIQALRWYVDSLPDDVLSDRLGPELAELGRLIPEIARRLNIEETAEAPLDDSARYRLFDAVRGWLVAAAGDSAVVLVIDDVHWATEQTLQLVAHLLRSPEPLPLFVLATARSTEEEAPARLDDILDWVASEDARHLRIDLAGLSRESVAKLVGQDRAPAIHEQTAGNPLFVEAMASASPGSDAPRSVQAAARLRVAPLADDVQEILRVASLMGLVVELDVLAAACDLEVAEALGACETATRVGLFEEIGPMQFRWTHGLVRNALAEQLGSTRGLQTHAAIARSIEAIKANDLDHMAAPLAHHYSCSQALVGPDKAYEYLLRAARVAESQLSYNEAIAHYTHALSLAETAGDREMGAHDRPELLLSVGRMHRLAGHTSEALTHLEGAVEHALQAGRVEVATEAAIEFEEASFFPGLPGHSAASLLAAVREALPAASYALRARVLASQARALDFSGQPSAAVAAADDAVASLERCQDARAEMHVLSLRCSILWQWDDLPQKLVHVARLNELAEPRHGGAFLYAKNYATYFAQLTGDMATALAEHAVLSEAAQRLRDPLWVFTVDSHAFALAMIRADYEEAEACANRAMDLAEVRTAWDQTGLFGLRMFVLRWEQGRLPEVAPLLRIIIDRSDRPFWRPGLAALHVETGDLAAASDELDRLAEDDFKLVGGGYTRDLSFVLLAEVCAAVGRADMADRIARELKELEPYVYQTLGSGVVFGPGARSLGVLATTSGRYGDAERLLTAAVRTSESMAANGFLARALKDRARLYATRQDRGDRQRAADDVDRGLRLTALTGQRRVEADLRAVAEEMA